MPVAMKSTPLYVAGHKHYQEPFADLGEGEQPGLLVREPTNSFDANAIMVMTEDGGTKLGYVPAWKAQEWAPAMDDDAVDKLSCVLNVRSPDPDKGLYRAEILNVEGAEIVD